MPIQYRIEGTVIYGSQWVEFQIPSLSVVGYMILLM
jgi:hypothetical protein